NKIQNYPQDIEYLKTLAQEIGLSENEHYKLSSIIGVGELEHLLKNSKRHYFNPDTPPRGHLQESDLENLARREYGFNLHIHTTASDGTMTPLELINQAAEYADKLKEINPEKSFCIAITDHDTMEGAKEILRAVAENPERYKNLKIVLGVELSAAYRDKDKLNFPMSYELIGYCVNPYDKRADEYLKNLRLARINESKRVISEAAKIYPQYNFTYDEACKFAKNPKKGIDGFLYTIGWYFKSKAPEVDTYDLALKYLPSNEKKPPYVIYEADELYDAMKDATGFFGIAHPGRINVSDN
ncbi:hypothetical protein IJ531_02870, partial [bacterium]|nr:hypothetical protein [bacterium]